MKNILITGGAGFIGSHLGAELISHGYHVTALDNLSEQVHGKNCRRPEYLHPDINLVVGDVRDAEVVRSEVQKADAVFHFAAMVGVGQSMYQIRDYTDVNNLGTAVLMEALLESPVKKLIVASSMSIYGEGLYKSPSGKITEMDARSMAALKAGKWELEKDGQILEPVATPEWKSPDLSSIYALSKYDQEKMSLITGRAYDIPTVAMRFFNVYGPHQALSNPYTGVMAIFASRLLNNNAPLVYEDGNQRRDFVHVTDVARACRLALETSGVEGLAFNIGSGNSYSVLELADRLAAVMGKDDISPKVTGKYRKGDIRHCFADISLAREKLGYQPQVSIEDGMQELAAWLETQIAVDNVEQASKELISRGLTV